MFQLQGRASRGRCAKLIFAKNMRWKALARSTQCTPLHRSRGIRLGALISIFSSKIAKMFSRLNNWISDFSNSSSNFAFFLWIFDDFFSGFRAKLQRRVRSVAFQPILRKRIRKLPKFLKILKIIQFYSIVSLTSASASSTIWPSAMSWSRWAYGCARRAWRFAESGSGLPSSKLAPEFSTYLSYLQKCTKIRIRNARTDIITFSQIRLDPRPKFLH